MNRNRSRTWSAVAGTETEHRDGDESGVTEQSTVMRKVYLAQAIMNWGLALMNLALVVLYVDLYHGALSVLAAVTAVLFAVTGVINFMTAATYKGL